MKFPAFDREQRNYWGTSLSQIH